MDAKKPDNDKEDEEDNDNEEDIDNDLLLKKEIHKDFLLHIIFFRLN